MISVHCLLCEALTVCRLLVVCLVYWGWSAQPLKVYSSLDVLCLQQNSYSTGIIHLSELTVDNSSLL